MPRATRKRTFETPRPFLKWVGGKGQLLGELCARVEQAHPFNRYHEPFVGGGALFFGLWRANGLGKQKAILSDNNERLIEVYHGVQSNVESVIELLEAHKRAHGKEYYYAVRASVPEDPIARAARLIYLNKTCFNGLFRENSKGLFNVPMGKYKDPVICDEENLRAVAEALGACHVAARPFEEVAANAQPGDFVYFDPPYHPLSKTSSFTSYHEGEFGEADQRRLAEVVAALTRNGVKVMLSNSTAPLIEELYGADYNFARVLANRAINSKADARGKIAEALVCNF